MSFSNKINDFLNIICNEIYMEQSHKKIRNEIKDHILDQKDIFIEEGFNEVEAEEKAILEMGNPTVIGLELNKVYKKRINYYLLLFPLILMGISFFNQINMNYTDISKLLTYFMISIFFIYLGFKMDYIFILKYDKKIYIITLLYELFNFIIIKENLINNLNIGSIIIPVLLVSIFHSIRNDYKGYLKGLIYLILPGILFLKSSYSSFMIYFITSIILYYRCYSKNNSFNYKFIIIIGLLSLILSIYIWNKPYLLERINIFFNPFIDVSERGYLYNLINQVNMESTLYEGTNHIIPTINQQFTIVYMVSKFGKIYSLIIFTILICFIHTLIKNRRAIKNKYAKELNLSIIILLSTQYIIYILNNKGYIIGNMNIPFIRYDLKMNIISMFLIGILLSTYNLDIVYKNEKFFEKII